PARRRAGAAARLHAEERHRAPPRRERRSRGRGMNGGTAMLTSPYRKLMQHKRWATDGLNGVVAEHMARIDEPDRVLVLRLLDHIQAVDEIFRHNLERRPHGHAAPRSAELPDFETLARKARATGAWYADHVGALSP